MSSYYCYLVKSEATPKSKVTYIGFSTQPSRRLRQHNGELTQGAWKTSKHRPWIHIAIVRGFPNKITALQFEWQWQHPHISRITKQNCPKNSNSRIGRYGSDYKHKLRVLISILESPLWKQLNLSIAVFDQKVKDELISMKAGVRIKIATFGNALEMEQVDVAARAPSVQCEGWQCQVCKLTLSSCGKRWWHCPECRSGCHVLCTPRGGDTTDSIYVRNDSNMSLSSSSSSKGEFMPQSGSCVTCGSCFRWYTIVKLVQSQCSSHEIDDTVDKNEEIEATIEQSDSDDPAEEES